jgi:putative hydrolase of the HAD superfamily
MSRAKKAIVFDVAGVLLHWQPLALIHRLLPDLTPDEASLTRWGEAIYENWLGDWGEFDRGRLDITELVARIHRRTGLQPDRARAVVEAVPHALQPMADTIALLHRLAEAGHRVHYLSNMPAPFADLLEARESFFQRFDSGVFSARVHHNKPEPAIYALAADRFEAEPEDLVFLDDTLGNVLAAQALGWHALHFVGAARSEADMRRAGWVA